MGVATSDRQRSKIDDIWASMNASGADATAPPAGGSGTRLAEGKGKKATKKKKKANQKANKVMEENTKPCLRVVWSRRNKAMNTPAVFGDGLE